MTRFARGCKNCDFSKTTWWLKTTLPRIGQLGTKIYQQTCVLDDWVWTLKMNVWTASFWWVYINTKTPKVLGNALVNMLALQRRFLNSFYSIYRFWLPLSERSTSLFVLAGKRPRMGTCKVWSDWCVQLWPIEFHVQLLQWSCFWRTTSWLETGQGWPSWQF